MLVTFQLPTQPAGSSGGLTLYKHGATFAGRSRAYPKRVRGNAHNVPMSLIAELSQWWERPLSNAQRIAWGNYAFNSPLTDAYGNPRYIKGYAHFLRSGRARLQQGLDWIADGPTVYGLPPYTLPLLALSADNSTLTATITPADDWANEDNAAMLFWASRATRTAVNRPPETYAPLGRIDGLSGGIIATWTFAMPAHTQTTPARLWIRTSVTRADGRLSGL